MFLISLELRSKLLECFLQCQRVEMPFEAKGAAPGGDVRLPRFFVKLLCEADRLLDVEGGRKEAGTSRKED